MRKPIHIQGILLLCFFCTTLSAQTFQWNRIIKSEGFEEAYDLVTDNAGYVYVCGMIEYEADFGNGVILESAGIHDIFIAKYDTSGNLIWARRAGGRGGDKAQSITLDGQGYLYIAGEFEDTTYWGSIMKIAVGTNSNNVFVARYDTSGNVQWVQSLGTEDPWHTRGYGVTTDAQSNVYVAGGTMGNTYYNGNFLFTSAGDYDGIIFSFDKFGNYRWARRMGGTDSDKARRIISDQGSSIYVTGYFSNTANFSGTTLSTRGHTDVFLAKYDTAGSLLWVTQAGDTGFDRAWDIDINVNGQILIAGDESRGLFDAHIASCQGQTDAFVAGYDTSGNNLWVVAGGGGEDDEGRGVSHDASGNVYLVGDYGGSAIFPPVTYTGNHYAEPFFASYTPDGSALRWVRNGSGPSNDRGVGIGLDNAGNIYACGNFEDSLSLGSMLLHGDSLLDIYVTRLSAQNICSSSASVIGNIGCFGMCNGTATVSSFGQSPFTYTWNTSPVQHTETATGLCAGNYTVSVTDFTGCVSTASITLADPPELLVNSTFQPSNCFGACNGTAEATATGQSPFTYSWNTVPVQNTALASGLCEGNYTVTVTDASGCTATTSVTLTDPPELLVGATSTTISCFGSCDGTATAAATGNAPFTYSWNSVPVQNAITATGLCSGNYTVTVTDAGGCTSTSSTTLSDPPQLLINPVVTAVTCHGICNGSAEAMVSGQSPFTFLWNTVPVQTTETAVGLCAGSYSVTVTDGAGCTASMPALVSQPLELATSANITNASCTGCTDGALDLTVSGGTAPYQYLWSNGASTEDILNVGAGNYSVCVTDAYQCVQCDTFLVLDPSTGISTASELQFSVSPNPVTSLATIQMEGGYAHTTTLSVYNSIGSLIYKSEFQGNEYVLNAEDWQKGIYFLELVSRDQIKLVPLIRE